MRHRKSGRRLGRDMSHRKATMKHLAVALFKHDAIETGVYKAKELRMFAEPLITLAKTDTVANRRRAFAKLRDDEVVRKLFNDTRIMRLGNRVGDAAETARIELVDRGEYKVD